MTVESEAVFMRSHYFKHRPAPHKLENLTTKQHAGRVIAARPKPYPMTSQQKKVKETAEKCAIKSGMSRAALVTAMKDCVGPAMRK